MAHWSAGIGGASRGSGEGRVSSRTSCAVIGKGPTTCRAPVGGSREL